MHESFQYGGIVTPPAEVLMSEPKISMKENLCDVNGSKFVPLEPMAQVSEETKFQISGLFGVALFVQKVCIGVDDVAQRPDGHRRRKGKACKELGHDVFSFGLTS
jgi:hypothetical protein